MGAGDQPGGPVGLGEVGQGPHGVADGGRVGLGEGEDLVVGVDGLGGLAGADGDGRQRGDQQLGVEHPLGDRQDRRVDRDAGEDRPAGQQVVEADGGHALEEVGGRRWPAAPPPAGRGSRSARRPGRARRRPRRRCSRPRRSGRHARPAGSATGGCRHRSWFPLRWPPCRRRVRPHGTAGAPVPAAGRRAGAAAMGHAGSMATDPRRLGMFPLSVVMFPHTGIPLLVFEPALPRAPQRLPGGWAGVRGGPDQPGIGGGRG